MNKVFDDELLNVRCNNCCKIFHANKVQYDQMYTSICPQCKNESNLQQHTSDKILHTKIETFKQIVKWKTQKLNNLFIVLLTLEQLQHKHERPADVTPLHITINFVKKHILHLENKLDKLEQQLKELQTQQLKDLIKQQQEGEHCQYN